MKKWKKNRWLGKRYYGKDVISLLSFLIVPMESKNNWKSYLLNENLWYYYIDTIKYEKIKKSV